MSTLIISDLAHSKDLDQAAVLQDLRRLQPWLDGSAQQGRFREQPGADQYLQRHQQLH